MRRGERQHGFQHGAVAHMQMPVIGFSDRDPLAHDWPTGTKVLCPCPTGAAAAVKVSAIGSLTIAPASSATRLNPRLSHHSASCSMIVTSADRLRQML